MKKIKNTLINIALTICFFLLAGMAIGQQKGTKGIDCLLYSHWSITRDLNFECRYNVRFHTNYLPGNEQISNGTALPHGIYIRITGGYIAGIGTLQSTSGWFNNAPQPSQVPNIITPGLQEIFWIKQMHCGGNALNAPDTKLNMIENNELLFIPIDIAPDPGFPDIKIHAELIYGSAWPPCSPIASSPGIPVACGACNPPNYINPPLPVLPLPLASLDCPYDSIFPHDTCNYQIICNAGNSWPPNLIPLSNGCMLCLPDNRDANLSLSPTPTPSPWTKIFWYKYVGCNPPPPAPCPCPSTPVTITDLSNPSIWELVLTQINPTTPFYATGQLEATTCYVATIQTGCDLCITDPVTLWVCQPLPSVNISAVPALTWINNSGWHACEQWSGNLNILPYVPRITCESHITWERWDFLLNQWLYPPLQSLNYYPPYNNPMPDPFVTPLLNLVCNTSPTDCDSIYKFRVVLEDICGNSTESPIDIHVDKRTEDCPYTFAADPAWIGTITGTSITNPIFCDSGATVLKFDSHCLKIKQWEISELIDPCGSATWSPWTVLSQAGTSNIYWTNILHNTTKYRAWIYNGSCLDLANPVYTSELEVTIIPEANVILTTHYNYMCTGCPLPTLTATNNCPTYYSITSYEWAVNGTIVATTTGNTFQVNSPGSWTVNAIGGVCGPLHSNRIIICDSPSLSVEGPLCCIPPGISIGGPWCFCDGESITLTAVVGGCNVQTITYEWRDPNGQPISTNASVNVTLPGTYTVTAICDNCCVISTTATTIQCPSTSP